MVCVSCGKPLPAGSRFCNVCGEEQPAKSTESPVRTASDGPIFELRPTMRFIVGGYILAGLVAIGVAALVAMLDKPFWVVLIIAAILLAIPGWYHLRREAEVYRLTNNVIEIRRGLISR